MALKIPIIPYMGILIFIFGHEKIRTESGDYHLSIGDEKSPVPVEPVDRLRRNRQGHHIICSPPLWIDQSNSELWLAVE